MISIIIKRYWDLHNNYFFISRRRVVFIIVSIFVIIRTVGQCNALPCVGTDAICTFINDQYTVNLASGNWGDYYNNRDDFHANFDVSQHPQLSRFDGPRGACTTYYPGKIVIGNASLAYATDNYGQWTSLTRHAFMRYQSQADIAYRQYINNNHYWYPEHVDHDAKDMYHAMFPYVSTSQGSSYSELDEIKKFVYTLAAFRPEVKKKLKDEGLLMPTMQMLFRRTRVADDGEYLSGKAHPSAFDNNSNTMAMVTMANGILIDAIPPCVTTRTLDDSFDETRQVDFFEPYNYRERLFDTPASIARIFRGRDYTKYIVVSATGSYDVNGRPLTYHWAVLRGDPAHVRIQPLDAQQTQVRIEIDYHTESPVDGLSCVSNLVVVGAFVHNGIYYSAPAFVTSYSICNEARIYNENNLLTEISYSDPYKYLPISYPKEWDKDAFFYDEHGLLEGWFRHDGAEVTEYSADGCIVLEKNTDGDVVKAQEVNYVNNGSEYLRALPLSLWSNTVVYMYEIAEVPNDKEYAVHAKEFINYNPADICSFLLVTYPRHGTAAIDGATGDCTYVPDDGYIGYDVFSIKIVNDTQQTAFILRIVVQAGEASDPGPDPDPEPKPDPEPDSADLYHLPAKTAIQCWNNVINPAKGEEATVRVELDKQALVAVVIYDSRGREVTVLVDEEKQPGFYFFPWDGRDDSGAFVGSGIYLVYIKTGGYTETKKIGVIK